jgi:hypothetical protein
MFHRERKEMSKATIYCSLTKYLASVHTSFYEIIDSACLTRALKPHVRGVTVFIPPDSVITNIAGLLASSQQKDVKEGHDKIRAYIIGDVFSTPEEFKSSDKHVVNYLGNIVKVEVSGNNVTVADGSPPVKLTLDPKAQFLDRETGPRVAVWMASAPLSGKGEKFTKSTPPKKNKKAVGGYYGGNNSSDNGGQVDRLNIEEHLRSELARSVTNSISNGQRGHYINPYIRAMNQLYFILEEKDKTTFNNIIKYKDDLAELDFYMFVQPYSTSSEKLIPDDIICIWRDFLNSDGRAPIEANNEYIQRGKGQNKDMTTLSTVVNKYLSQCECDEEEIRTFYATDPFRAWCDEMRIKYKLKFITAMYSADPPAEYTSIAESIRNTYPHKEDYARESYIVSGKSVTKMLHYMVSTDVLSYSPGAERNFGDQMDQSMSPKDLIATLRESNVYISLSGCAKQAYIDNVLSIPAPQYGAPRNVQFQPLDDQPGPSTPPQIIDSPVKTPQKMDSALDDYQATSSVI